MGTVSKLKGNWLDTNIYMVAEEPNKNLGTKGECSLSAFRLNMNSIESFYILEGKDELEEMLGKTVVYFESGACMSVDIWFNKFLEIHDSFIASL